MELEDKQTRPLCISKCKCEIWTTEWGWMMENMAVECICIEQGTHATHLCRAMINPQVEPMATESNAKHMSHPQYRILRWKHHWVTEWVVLSKETTQQVSSCPCQLGILGSHGATSQAQTPTWADFDLQMPRVSMSSIRALPHKCLQQFVASQWLPHQTQMVKANQHTNRWHKWYSLTDDTILLRLSARCASPGIILKRVPQTLLYCQLLSVYYHGRWQTTSAVCQYSQRTTVLCYHQSCFHWNHSPLYNGGAQFWFEPVAMDLDWSAHCLFIFGDWEGSSLLLRGSHTS